jgi:hypothetical protein
VIRSMRIGILGICLVSMLVVSAMGASSAFAGKHNPEFRWCQLTVIEKTGFWNNRQCSEPNLNKEGEWEQYGWFPWEQEQLEVAANKNQILKSTGLNLTIECEEVKVNPTNAHIFGGEGVTEKLGGKNETKAIEYRKCKVVKPENCEVRSKGATNFGEINTKEVVSNLVFENSEAATTEKTFVNGKSAGLVLFKPREGKLFVTLEFRTGPKEKPTCSIPSEGAVEGEVLTKALGNPEELKTEHEIEALPKTKIYWVNEGGKQVKKEIISFKAVGFGAELEGKDKLNLKSLDKWCLFN